MTKRLNLEQGIAAYLGEPAPVTPAADNPAGADATSEPAPTAAIADDAGQSDQSDGENGEGTTAPETAAAGDDAEPAAVDEPEPDPNAAESDGETATDEGEPATDDDDRRSAVILHPDGKRETVSVGHLKQAFLELRQSNFRQQDYSRKTAVVAQELSQVADVGQMRKRYREVIDTLDDGIIVPPAPDPALAQEDVAAFIQQDAAHRQAIERKAQLAAARKKVDDEAALENRHRRAIAQRQCADVLLRAVPAWQDHKVFERDQKEMQEAATALGYTPEEQRDFLDPRMIFAIYQLAQLRKAVTNGKARLADGKAATATAQPAARPVGAPGTSGRRTGPTIAQQRLATARNNHSQRRSVDSAVDLLMAMEGRR